MDPMFKGFRYLSLSLFLVLLGLLAKGKEKVSLEPVPYTGYAKTWLEIPQISFSRRQWLLERRTSSSCRDIRILIWVDPKN